jgi:hypothetical protein
MYNNYYKNGLMALPIKRVVKFAATVLPSLTSDNVGGVHTARITGLTGALNTIDGTMSDVATKLAIRKGKVLAKRLFREGLSAQIAQIHAAVIVAFGVNSPDLAECFPAGRRIFNECAEQELDDHLQQMQDCVTARAASLPAAIVTNAASLLTTWTALMTESGVASSNVGTERAARQAARSGLCQELFLLLMHLGGTYQDDAVKFAQYWPGHLLDTATGDLPGLATIEVTGGEGIVNATALSEGAESIQWSSRVTGSGLPLAPLGSTAANEEVSLDLPAGQHDISAHGVNDEGDGPESAVVTVTVT